jgi:predicted O-methyltransferase YrrM
MTCEPLEFAKQVKGFMPENEGLLLFQTAKLASAKGLGPVMEIGSYCGKSTIYLGCGAKLYNNVVFSLDHHRGSEEMQPGWEHHDPEVVDPLTGKMDSLFYFRQAINHANLETTVIAIIGESGEVAKYWRTPLSMVFIDGGHGKEPAYNDYRSWAPFIVKGGFLAIHDVFEDESLGGRPPFEIYQMALESQRFIEIEKEGSLRILRCLAESIE